ncbi:S41 family peptidase [Flavobacterium sp. N1718]|uniref:S41 family peptidase n=1 Tax=Flavobacterium sp. N1718 TaxID=2986822 RepID=UPI0039B590EC
MPDLADDRFASQKDLEAFLRGYPDPFDLFDHLRVNESIDRFSFMVSDYSQVENLFAGVSKSNGVDFGLKYRPGSTTDVFGWVRYILPGSDAATKDIRRGDIFYAIDGTPLTVSNYQQLLAQDTYTLNLADFDGGNLTPNGRSITLTKAQLTENPVYIKKVIEQGGNKIGYLMYNGFTADFDPQLNDAFGEFKAAGVTHLVLDLRYNSGGSVRTASRLASMITGQFNGELFSKQQWNPDLQAYFEENNPSDLAVNFVNSIGSSGINSLNLNKVYILTTKSTASASELVINGLKPYITVVQIGDVTVGKNVGSVTLYDSPDFGRDGRSTKHKYAMQPIVIKMINADDFGDYQDGITPTIAQLEDFDNLGTLGETTEPYLNTALTLIAGGGRRPVPTPAVVTHPFRDTRSMRRFGTDMYIETPTSLGRR